MHGVLPLFAFIAKLFDSGTPVTETVLSTIGQISAWNWIFWEAGLIFFVGLIQIAVLAILDAAKNSAYWHEG